MNAQMDERMIEWMNGYENFFFGFFLLLLLLESLIGCMNECPDG